jgi:hypothetical protein
VEAAVGDVGDLVTAEQLRALFGCGLHPLTETRLQQKPLTRLRRVGDRPPDSNIRGQLDGLLAGMSTAL